jgi:hypothetical protein
MGRLRVGVKGRQPALGRVIIESGRAPTLAGINNAEHAPLVREAFRLETSPWHGCSSRRVWRSARALPRARSRCLRLATSRRRSAPELLTVSGQKGITAAKADFHRHQRS